MPGLSPENRAVGEAFDLYAREGRFYADLAPGLPRPGGRRSRDVPRPVPRRDVRRRHERDLVRAWRGAANGPTDYSYELAWDHYRRMTLFTTVFPVVLSVTLDLQNERGLELMESMIVRSFAAAVDLDAGALLPD